MVKRLLLVVVIAACASAGCGGGSKAAPQTPGGAGGAGDMYKDADGNSATTGLSECDVMAGHIGEVVMGSKEAPPVPKDTVIDVIAKACKRDGWSADSIKCFGAITDANGGEQCAKQLTADQQTKLKADADTQFKGRKKHAEMSDDDADDAAEGKMGGRGKPAPASKAPPAPPKGGSKGPVRSNDPCEGGE